MKLAVGLLQTTLHWESVDANLSHLEAQLAGTSDTDLVVLPEMFSTGFSMRSAALAESMSGAAPRWLRRQAQRLNAGICGSLIISDDERYVNRFIYASPDSDQLQWYDKKHLFRMSEEQKFYSAGNSRLVFECAGFQLCAQVCYDLRFPVWSRQRDDYDVLLYVANWPARRSSHWRALLRARAIENQCYCIGVNRLGRDGNGIDYQGDSMVIDYNGETLLDAKDSDGVFQVELDYESLADYRRDFPAHLDADSFKLI